MPVCIEAAERVSEADRPDCATANPRRADAMIDVEKYIVSD